MYEANVNVEIDKFIISVRDWHLRKMDRLVSNHILDHGLADCDPRAKSDPSPVFGKFY